MNGPARVDTKWKDIAARPFKVVVLVESAAQARKEGCTQSDAAKVHCCGLAGSLAGLLVHGEYYCLAMTQGASRLYLQNLGIDVFT